MAAPSLFCIDFFIWVQAPPTLCEKKRVEPKDTDCGGTDFVLHRIFIWVQAPPALCEKKRVEPKETDCAAPSLVCVDFYIKNASQNEKHFLCKIDSKAPIEKVFESC